MRGADLNGAVLYREFQPPTPLAGHVQCIWRLRDTEAAGAEQTIYPDGRCEIIAHFGPTPFAWEGNWRRQSALLFAGQRVTALRLRTLGGINCLGVRLTPAASAALVGGGLEYLRDRVVELEGLDAAFAHSFATAARRFTSDAHDKALETLLLKRFGATPVDARIVAAVRTLEATGGNTRIAALATAAGLSARAFQENFLRDVGLTAKEFARLTRLQVTLRALDASEQSLSDTAQQAGFADQAHATREVVRLTGLAPAKLRTALRTHRDGDDTVRLAAAFIRGQAG
jgi:AraC-like DNA-binding protein